MSLKISLKLNEENLNYLKPLNLILNFESALKNQQKQLKFESLHNNLKAAFKSFFSLQHKLVPLNIINNYKPLILFLFRLPINLL